MPRDCMRRSGAALHDETWCNSYANYATCLQLKLISECIYAQNLSLHVHILCITEKMNTVKNTVCTGLSIKKSIM
jgi:hypothetical protein